MDYDIQSTIAILIHSVYCALSISPFFLRAHTTSGDDMAHLSAKADPLLESQNEQSVALPLLTGCCPRLKPGITGMTGFPDHEQNISLVTRTTTSQLDLV